MMTRMVNFETAWARIVAFAGDQFSIKNGSPLHYRIEQEYVYPDRTHWRISKKDFAKAWELMPLSGPGVIHNLVQGPSYVYAILTDARISG